MYSSTDAAHDAAEREWDAMTEEERDAWIDEQDAAETINAAAYERWESPTPEEDAIAAIEGGNGITIRNGNLTTVASMVAGVAQMEAFNAAGQSVGATPFANTADLLDACRIIAMLSAWQVVGGDEDDADSANWEPVIDYEPRRVVGYDTHLRPR